MPNLTSCIFSAINIFVMPSLWEGQPIALLETLAIGKPCIATSVDGIPEIITNDVNGYLVNLKNIEELSKIMDFAIQNPDTLQNIARSASNTISKKFLAQNMANAIADIYLASNFDKHHKNK
jgi:glycosyltransferase involved in cell wall biosynthesis